MSNYIYKVPPPWTGPVQTPQQQQQQEQNMYNQQQQYIGVPQGGIEPGTATGVPSYSSGGYNNPPTNQYQQPGAQQYPAQQQYPAYQSTYQQPPPPPPPPPAQWGQPAQQQWQTPPVQPPRPQSTIYNPMQQGYHNQNQSSAYSQYGQASTPVGQQQYQPPPPPPPPPPVQTQSPYGQNQQVYQGDNSYQQPPAEQIHQSQGHQWHSTPQQQYVQVAEQGQQQQGYYGGVATGNTYNASVDSMGSPTSEHPAYIPPSLSGAGVNAYQPVDTNPAPGVYIPPPPTNIPAWGTAQQGGPKKKFTYTPPVLHPDYATPASQYNSNQQQYQYHGSPSHEQQYQAQHPPPPPPPATQPLAQNQQTQQDNFWPQTQSQGQGQGQYEQPQQQYQQNPPAPPETVAYQSHFQQQQPTQTPVSSPPPLNQQETFPVQSQAPFVSKPASSTTTTAFTGPIDNSWEYYGSGAGDENVVSRPETPVEKIRPVKPTTPVQADSGAGWPQSDPISPSRYPPLQQQHAQTQFQRPGSAFQQGTGFKRPSSRAGSQQGAETQFQRPGSAVRTDTGSQRPPSRAGTQQAQTQFQRPGSAFQQGAGFKRPASAAGRRESGSTPRPKTSTPKPAHQSPYPVTTHPDIAEMAVTEKDESQPPAKSPTAPYVFKDPRLGWAETPQGGMTNVQGPPLDNVTQPLEQMWPVQQQQETQGWPEPPPAQESQGWPHPQQPPQDNSGWPQPETQTGKPQQQGWPEPQSQQPQQQTQTQLPDTGGWPQPPIQQLKQQDAGGWPQHEQTQPLQQTENQQPAAGGWPQPPQAAPQQQDTPGWPQPPQAEPEQKKDSGNWPQSEKVQTGQTQQGWPEPQQAQPPQQTQNPQPDAGGWPQPPQVVPQNNQPDTAGWPQPPQAEPQQQQQGWPQPQQESPQRKPYWEQPTQEQVQEQQKQAQQADVRPVPGGWPQSSQQQEETAPGGWPQPPSLNSTIQTQSSVEVRSAGVSQPLTQQIPQQQEITTPESTITPASSHIQDQFEKPDPLDNLEKFYEDSIRRFIDMIQAEVAATTDEDKLKVFTEFMENEYFVRGQRYPNALGGPPSGRNSFVGKLGLGFGTAEKAKDSNDKLDQVVEVAVESRAAELKQPIFQTPVAPPATFTAPAAIVEVGGWPSPEPRAISPTSFPEVVPQVQKPPTPTPLSRSPEPPISPEPLVINKRSSAYQPFRPDVAPKSPTNPEPNKYAAFNPHTYESPPPRPTENQYLPFQLPETSKATPEPNQPDIPLGYKPYNPVAIGQTSGRGSPIPVGPERGSQYVPYDPKRASVIMSGTPTPEKSHLKRDSGISAFPPPTRADTIPASPIAGGPRQPFGPLRSSKTFVDTYQSFAPGSGYPSSTGSSNVFSTPESDAPGGQKTESYFPSAPPAMEPTQSIQPLQTRKVAPPVPEELKSLLAVLPEDRAPRVQSATVLGEVKKTIEAIGEDFSFIAEINRAYTESAKKRRRGLDDERRKRAEEHEEYTDELFADQQIGYGDIKDMETEFKSEEARKEAKEEEDEYETYCSEVFQKVYDKLQEGIKGLMDKYLGIVRDLPIAVVGKDRWNTPTGVELTELLEGLLELTKYIETRHEKVQGAIIERDRRFKKTVIQPLYASGNIGKMKSMEKHFEESEKKTIHQAVQEKLKRTQQLMETIVESIERGLDAELNYTEEITAAVLALIGILPSPGHLNPMKGEIACAHATLKDLKEASVKFMKAFHSASLLLNACTNEVALAEAKLAGSGKDVIAGVAKEKDIADQETDKELQERVGVVEGDFALVDTSIMDALKILEEIVDDPSGGVPIDRVMSPVGAQAPAQGSQQDQGPGPGRGQGQSQGKGLSPLERAKLRNNSGGSGIPYA